VSDDAAETAADDRNLPRMASGALVNDTGLLARETRGDPILPHFLNQPFAVVAFGGATMRSTGVRAEQWI